MKIPAAFLILSVSASAGCALNPHAHPPGASGAAIGEASVRAHMEFLASDAMNGRGSGTRDEWIAATYLGAQLRRLGLEPLGDEDGYVQQIGIERSEASTPPALRLGGRRYTHGNEILVQLLGAGRIEGRLQKFVEGRAVERGAILLMPGTLPPGLAGVAAQASAVLVLETPQLRQRWAQLGARMPPVAVRLTGVESPSRPTTIALDQATYATLSALPDGTEVVVEAETTAPRTTHTWNAVGRLPGSDPGSAAEVILLSAHLDHVGNRPASDRADGDSVYNGADDDASGTVAVLEIAAALAAGPRPKRTVVFAFFGSEEAGGHGSAYFVDNPVVPLSQIVANLQFEMIGRPDGAVPPRTLWLTGYERSTLGPALAQRGARLVQDPHPSQNFFARSDNIRFARRGVVAHTVSSFGLHKDYHQPSDELRFIDFDHLTEAIQSLLEPIRWLANTGFRPEWVPGGQP